MGADAVAPHPLADRFLQQPQELVPGLIERQVESCTHSLRPIETAASAHAPLEVDLHQRFGANPLDSLPYRLRVRQLRKRVRKRKKPRQVIARHTSRGK